MIGFWFFSPSGKLVQIEYALAAVAAGGPSVGIKGTVHGLVSPIIQ
jgi:20S proteasome subunit alpha 2